jgi:hypothetical protein
MEGGLLPYLFVIISQSWEGVNGLSDKKMQKKSSGTGDQFETVFSGFDFFEKISDAHRAEMWSGKQKTAAKAAVLGQSD